MIFINGELVNKQIKKKVKQILNKVVINFVNKNTYKI